MRGRRGFWTLLDAPVGDGRPLQLLLQLLLMLMRLLLLLLMLQLLKGVR